MNDKGLLRRALSRWADPEASGEQDLRSWEDERRVVAIGDAVDREKVVLSGVLRTVTLRPRGGVPALEADLGDPTGSITVVWLGRRRIAGIDPGRAMTVEGRIGTHGKERVMFNPRYELLP